MDRDGRGPHRTERRTARVDVQSAVGVGVEVQVHAPARGARVDAIDGHDLPFGKEHPLTLGVVDVARGAVEVEGVGELCSCREHGVVRDARPGDARNRPGRLRLRVVALRHRCIGRDGVGLEGRVVAVVRAVDDEMVAAAAEHEVRSGEVRVVSVRRPRHEDTPVRVLAPVCADVHVAGAAREVPERHRRRLRAVVLGLHVPQLAERVPEVAPGSDALLLLEEQRPARRLVTRWAEENGIRLDGAEALVRRFRVEVAIAEELPVREAREYAVRVPHGEAVHPGVHLRLRGAVLLERTGHHRVLCDAERSVLPASPVTAHHEARGARAGRLTCERRLHELVGEETVERLGPQMSVGAAVRPDGDGGERLRDCVASVIVVARLVVEISAERIVVDPGRQAASRLSAQRIVHTGCVVQPVVDEREEGPVPAHRVTGVVSHRDENGRRWEVAVPLVSPIERRVRGRAAQLVVDGLVVVQRRLPVGQRRAQIFGVTVRLVGERASEGSPRPAVAVRATAVLVVFGMVDGLLAALHELGSRRACAADVLLESVHVRRRHEEPRVRAGRCRWIGSARLHAEQHESRDAHRR